jgi:hypothetical protein
VAELLGVDTDLERAIRRPLMVLSYDPPAIALTAATSARPRAFDEALDYGAEGSGTANFDTALTSVLITTAV